MARGIKNKYGAIKGRLSPSFLTLLLFITAAIPIIDSHIVHAYGLVSSRSITMSASANNDINVSYAVKFTTYTTSAIEGIVVDFCSNSPIIGQACTAPTGFTVGAPTLSPNVTCSTSCALGTWTPGTLNSGRTLTITNSTSNTINAGVTVNFTITTVTNPTSTPATFYARILDYTTGAGATGYTATAPGSEVDAGGVALSTVGTVTINATVQEQLTFCLYQQSTTAAQGAAPSTGDGGACTVTTNSSVTLGNANDVLSAAGPYVDVNTHYDIQTNALHGATIVFTGSTLTSGSNTIEASSVSGTDTSSATANDSSTTGSPQFGLCTYAVGGTTANLTAAASGTYSGGTCSSATQTAGYATTGGTGTAKFGFNITAASSTGDTLANFPNPGAYATGDIVFMGNIAYTTIAAIYSTTLKFIATSTY